MKEQNQTKSTNIKWHNLTIDREKLEKMRGHKGMVICLANALNEVLHLDGFSTYVLDGDNIRHGLCKDLGFSDEDREENIRRIGEVANLYKKNWRSCEFIYECWDNNYYSIRFSIY